MDYQVHSLGLEVCRLEDHRGLSRHFLKGAVDWLVWVCDLGMLQSTFQADPFPSKLEIIDQESHHINKRKWSQPSAHLGLDLGLGQEVVIARALMQTGEGISRSCWNLKKKIFFIFNLDRDTSTSTA
jgi:hypothetical protein